MRALTERIVPGREWQTLAADHAIFRSFFLLDRAWGRRKESRQLLGIDLDRRTAAVYFAGDLAGAVAEDAGGQFLYDLDGSHEHRTMAVRFGVNLLFYSLTLDYKQDQIHVPFILSRKR